MHKHVSWSPILGLKLIEPIRLDNCRTDSTGFGDGAITRYLRGRFSSFLSCWKDKKCILKSIIRFGSQCFFIGLKSSFKCWYYLEDGKGNLHFVKSITSWSCLI